MVELITIGFELLNGHTLNSNALFVGEQLAARGLTLTRHTTVGDIRTDIRSALTDALERVKHVIVSGGLGPTHDDITKQTIAEYFGQKLVLNTELLAAVKQRFAKAGLPMPKANESQAMVPEQAEIIPNAQGTAPGLVFRRGENSVYVVPGVPHELRPMLVKSIFPHIERDIGGEQIATATLMTTGWPESRLYEALTDTIEQSPDVHVAFLPSRLGVKIRLRASGADGPDHLRRWIESARRLIGDATYTEEEKWLEAVIGEWLTANNKTLALAESCTGGLLAKRITDIPGSSNYFAQGFVTYSNESKIELLGVDSKALSEFGAVSAEVAKEMANGARVRARVDYAIAVTGIAGPGGGTASKPVGTVCIAVSGGQSPQGDTIARRLQLGGDRTAVRERSAQAALHLLWQRIKGTI